jgi:pimeloyl-ACP methyl ester carboxylesterase
MAYAERVARDIHYLDAGTGQPVVMLHGAGGLRVDEPVFSELAARFHLIAPSMPGFDASPPGTASNVIDVADVVAACIRQVAGRAHVVGESFGGAVSSWLAIRHPDVVDHLVLAAPAGLRQSGGPAPGQLTPSEMAVVLYGRPATEPIAAEVAQRRQHNRANAGRLAGARPAFDRELQEQLASIQAPTLILWGTADQMILPSQAQYFAERIPNARVQMIDAAPHVLSAAVPEDFLSAVLAFFEVAAVRA